MVKNLAILTVVSVALTYGVGWHLSARSIEKMYYSCVIDVDSQAYCHCKKKHMMGNIRPLSYIQQFFEGFPNDGVRVVRESSEACAPLLTQ